MDTIVVCTVTCLVILTSGVYHMEGYLADLAEGKDVISGTALTAGAFAAEYLFGPRGILPYKIFFVTVIYFGCTGSLELVWGIADTLNGFMAVPNLIAVALLSGEVIEMTRTYLSKNKQNA